MSDYNGWTNYATWRVNLEIFDGLLVQDLCSKMPTVSELRETIQEYAEQLIEDTTQPGLGRDYAYAFLADVNWWQIADRIIADTSIEETL